MEVEKNLNAIMEIFLIVLCVFFSYNTYVLFVVYV
jgi:hypothetical protein